MIWQLIIRNGICYFCEGCTTCCGLILSVLCFNVGLAGFLPIHPRTFMKSKRNKAVAASKQAELDKQKSDEETNSDKELNLPQSWFLLTVLAVYVKLCFLLSSSFSVDSIEFLRCILLQVEVLYELVCGLNRLPNWWIHGSAKNALSSISIFRLSFWDWNFTECNKLEFQCLWDILKWGQWSMCYTVMYRKCHGLIWLCLWLINQLVRIMPIAFARWLGKAFCVHAVLVSVILLCTRYLTNCLWEFYQICNLGTVRAKMN